MFEWWAHGFTRCVMGTTPNTKVGFVRQVGQLEFRVIPVSATVLASIQVAEPNADGSTRDDRHERHRMSEDEALGWFSIWMVDLEPFVSAKMRRRFRHQSEQFLARWPVTPDGIHNTRAPDDSAPTSRGAPEGSEPRHKRGA